MLRLVSLPLGAAAACAVIAGTAHAQDVQVVKIAHAGPVSGGIAHIGKDTENGVRLAVEDLNAQALVIGGKKIKFELAAEDDAGDPRQATAVAQKLCDQKVAGVVGHLQSGTSIPASAVYAKCDMPHITASASNPDLTKPGHKTTFRLIANDNALGAALALFGADEKKEGYQQLRATVAIGVGGVGGTGYLKGEQKSQVPEHQNDFIFSVIGEEGGLIGCTLVLAAFSFFFYRAWLVLYHGEDPFTHAHAHWGACRAGEK